MTMTIMTTSGGVERLSGESVGKMRDKCGEKYCIAGGNVVPLQPLTNPRQRDGEPQAEGSGE